MKIRLFRADKPQVLTEQIEKFLSVIEKDDIVSVTNYTWEANGFTQEFLCQIIYKES